MDKRKQTGRRGEELAAAYLVDKGYKIVAQNWRCQTGELDIIAGQGDTLVFVEVRTRSGPRFGTPEESVTPAKQARLIALAETYLYETGLVDSAWRIDVVAVRLLGNGPPQINHLENAVGW